MYTEFKRMLYSIIKKRDKRIDMKKTALILTGIMLFASLNGVCYAKSNTNSDLMTAIRMYKAQNYTQSYSKLQTYIKKDPSNPLAYYYLAMVYVQVGNQPEAIANYEKVMALAPKGGTLSQYAEIGKVCLEDAKACKELKAKEDYDFDSTKFGSGWTDSVRGQYEKLKLENIMREINRSEESAPADMRDFRDFSSMNNEAAPTNDEIVAAMRVLQRAGFSSNYGMTDASLLMGNGYSQNQMFNMFGSNMSPQLIQALMTNNMSMGF